MNSYEVFYETIFGYLKRFAFSEEWLAVDIAMSKQELFTLMTLDRLKEATMGQLSDQMNFPMSTATGIVDRLVRKGFIERGKSETDRRIVVVVLTEKGNDFTQKLKAMILSYIQKASGALSEEEVQTLLTIIDKVSASIRNNGPETEQNKKEQNRVRKIEIE